MEGGAMSYDGEPREVLVGEVQKVQVCLKHMRVEMGVGSPTSGERSVPCDMNLGAVSVKVELKAMGPEKVTQRDGPGTKDRGQDPG